MTFLAWHNGEIVRIPTAWVHWRIGEVDCRRDLNSSILAFIDEKWRLVESWQTFEDEPKPVEDSPVKEVRA